MFVVDRGCADYALDATDGGYDGTSVGLFDRSSL